MSISVSILQFAIQLLVKYTQLLDERFVIICRQREFDIPRDEYFYIVFLNSEKKNSHGILFLLYHDVFCTNMMRG